MLAASLSLCLTVPVAVFFADGDLPDGMVNEAPSFRNACAQAQRAANIAEASFGTGPGKGGC